MFCFVTLASLTAIEGDFGFLYIPQMESETRSDGYPKFALY